MKDLYSALTQLCARLKNACLQQKEFSQLIECQGRFTNHEDQEEKL